MADDEWGAITLGLLQVGNIWVNPRIRPTPSGRTLGLTRGSSGPDSHCHPHQIQRLAAALSPDIH